MAISSEAQSLCKEYAYLKRLLDSHKNSNMYESSYQYIPYRPKTAPHRSNVLNPSQFPRNGIPYARKNTATKSNLYSINRTTGLGPSFSHPKSVINRNSALTSQHYSQPEWSSRKINRIEAHAANPTFKKVPTQSTNSSTQGVTTPEEKTIPKLPTTRVQTTTAINGNDNKKPLKIAPSKGTSPKFSSKLVTVSSQTNISNKLATTKGPQTTSIPKMLPSVCTSTEETPELQGVSAQAINTGKLNTAEGPKTMSNLKMVSRIDILQKKASELQTASGQTSISSKLGSPGFPQATSTPIRAHNINASRKKMPQLEVISVQNDITRRHLPLAIPKNTPRYNQGIYAYKSVASKLHDKPDIKFSKRKPVTPQLKYKFVRTEFSLKPPCIGKTPISAGIGQVRRTPSKYKLVTTPKKISSKAKSPIHAPSKLPGRKQGHASKYTWCLGGAQVPKKSPQAAASQPAQNIIKSRYALSKTNVGVSPKLLRRVNKYSVKYVPRKQRVFHKIHVTKSQFGTKHFFAQAQPKRTSNLVVIGGILYKSSRNKLSRPADKKLDHLGPSCPPKANQQIVNVRGVRFSMDLNRKVMQRLPSTEEKLSAIKLQASGGPVTDAKPKGLTRIDIGGETYIQTRPGVLVRSGAKQLRNLANRVVNRSIFRLRASKGKSQQYCLFYNKFGKCNNKEKGSCPYIHDPEKIAICKRFLRGECTVEKCLFSHTICPSKMPVCTFFLLGRCNSDSCNYRHVNVNPNADICLDFAKGYCPQGEKCKNWHLSTCPQFGQSGKCDRGDKCPLKHQRRAAKVPKPSAVADCAVSSEAVETRPLASEDPTDEQTTRRRRCPSFISLANESDLDTPPKKVQKDVPLQIKPDFLKLI